MTKSNEIYEVARSKSGKCLSDEYINAHTKLLWQCAEGHQWEARLNSIKSGTWCPICARKSMFDSKKQQGLEKMKELALQKGGLCLSKDYLGVHTKLLWQCSAEHQWEKTPKEIKAGKWCPICRVNDVNKQHYENLKIIAHQRGCLLLSNEYKGSNTKLLWQCSEQHQWEARPHDIKKGVWCPVCAIKIRSENRKFTIEEMVKLAKHRGGKCLSKKYTDSETKLLWECSEGHQWKATPNAVNNGNSWCPTCAGNTRGTINEVQKIAVDRGGKCLSDIYINSKTKLLWECSEGHQWAAQPNSIKNGSWCPICGTEKSASVSRDNINIFKAIAEKRGGKCLSNKYVNSTTKLLWECAEGHQWEAQPVNINRGVWCPICAGNVKGSIQDMVALGKVKGGNCLSEKFINSETKLLWECSLGHQWEARPASIKRGNWCPICAGKAKGTIEEIQKIALGRGGKCLSVQYINTNTKLLWECSEGHQWESTPTRIKIGQWCPTCSSGIGERIVREFFEQIFKKPFPNCWPNWLLNDFGNDLELDGYNEELALAFEHQGRQHHVKIPYFHKSDELFLKRIKDDEQKRVVCKQKGILLIEIDEVPDMTKPSEIKDRIKDAFLRNKRRLPEKFENIEVDYKTAYTKPRFTENLKELNEISKARGGKCLSRTYKGSKTKLQWECAKGHRWWATPGSIKNSKTWCIKCAGKVTGTIEEMQKIANSKGGKCLSDNYVNIATKLLWECAEGHQWEAVSASIKAGSWCPVCGTNRTANALKDSIENFRDIAKKRNGKCLSGKYANSQRKLLFECSKSHQWKARPQDIKHGSWCPYCSKTAPKTIDDMKDLAQKKDGKCLSDRYINAHTKLLWECKFGHQWKAKPNNIQSGSWCPACADAKKNRIRNRTKQINSDK